MDKMPKLFEVNIIDKDEEKTTQFISQLHDKDFVGVNEAYLKNYIDSDLSIALSHIRVGYKKYVIDGNWSEEKYQGVIYMLVRHRQMLTSKSMFDYGNKYDAGKLTREINLEKSKYEKAGIELAKKKAKAKSANKETNVDQVSKEEQELLDYIAKNGGSM